MRDILLDVLRQIGGVNGIDAFKVAGTETETKVAAVDADKMFFIQGTLKEAIPEFVGEFGVSDLKLLNGLLNFTTFRTEDASITVKRGERGGKPFVEQLEFRVSNGSARSDYRFMSPDRLPEQAVIPNIAWDVIVEPSKSKVAEFTQLANLYLAPTQQVFGAKIVDGALIFSIGDDNDSSHRGSMAFADNVTGALKPGLKFPIDRYLTVVKLAGNYPTKLKITARGALAVEVETSHGYYTYFLRAVL